MPKFQVFSKWATSSVSLSFRAKGWAGLGWAGEKNLGAVRVELVLGVMRLDENTKKMRTHNKKEEAFEA